MSCADPALNLRTAIADDVLWTLVVFLRIIRSHVGRKSCARLCA
jgi:hypothetical protein